MEQTRERVGRFAELDAYRGIAALLVVVYHAYKESRDGAGRYLYEGTPWHAVWNNLQGAVDWFFVLSGFVIFLPFAGAALAGGQAPSARRFLVRRAWRLLPLYWLAIGTVWLWRYAGQPEQWLDLAEHLTFTHIFDQNRMFWTIGPAWSLAVEVAFYLLVAWLAPRLHRACARRGSTRERAGLLAMSAGALIGASIAFKWLAASILQLPLYYWPIYYSPLAKLDAFAFGMLLAAAVAGRARPVLTGRWPLRLRIAGLALIALACAWRASSPIFHEITFHTVGALGFLLVLASTALAARGSRWERALAHPALTYLGAISYGVYRWHEPILLELGKRQLLIGSQPGDFGRNALTLAVLAIAAATASHILVERPALRLRDAMTRRRAATPAPTPAEPFGRAAGAGLERRAA